MKPRTLSSARLRRPRRRLWLESLEPRQLLATFTVTTELDVVDVGDGLTSLREAISATNMMPGPDEIVFDFGHDGPAVILLEEGELEITEAVTITGDGPDLLTIDAQEQSRIFNITTGTGDFTIAGMTLTGGMTTGDNDFDDNTFSGGAVRSLTTGNLAIENCDVTNSLVTGSGSYGGGIFAEGDISVSTSMITGNSIAAPPCLGGSGGGISSNGAVMVFDSIVSGNSVTCVGHGGGVHAVGDVTLTSSTISNNSGAKYGGGVKAGGNVTVTSSTISDNLAGGVSSSGGGIGAGGDVSITSSTIARNSSGGNLSVWGEGSLLAAT